MTKPSKTRIRILIIILLFILGYAIFLQYYDSRYEFNDASLSRMMKKDADKAVEIAKKDYDFNLDYSPESIKLVDQILDQIHYQHVQTPLSKNQGIKTELLWGAYVGEVIRSNISCEWRVAIGNPLQLDDESYIYPTDWCHQKIVNDVDKNFLWNNYQLIIKGK